MIDIKSWREEYFFEAATDMVSGPGIEALKHAIYDMAHRGVPDQINDHGFNKIDFASYESNERNGYLTANKEIPAVAVTRMLDSLFRYSKRQLPDIFNNDIRTSPYYKSIQVQSYQDLKNLVEIDFKKTLQKKNPIVQYDSKKVVVFDKQFDKFGKNKVYIPGGVGVNSSLSKLIKEIAVKKLEEEEAGLEYNKFNGREELPVYKKYQKIEGEIDFYAVHPTILQSIVELL